MIEKGFIRKTGDADLRVMFCSDSIVRVTYGKADGIEAQSCVVTAVSGADVARASETEDSAVYTSDVLRVSVGGESVTFESACGEKLSRVHGFSMTPYDMVRRSGGNVSFRETVDGVRASSEGGEDVFVRRSNHGTMIFDFKEDETLFGLGSHEEGCASLKGHFVPMYQENMRISVPVFVSSKGYGVLIDCESVMTFDASDCRRGKVFLDSCDSVDFYFIYGGTFDGVCEGLRFLTGAAPMLPKWANGYIQSKERYSSQEELIRTVREYRRLGIPIDVIVQDWLYWRDGLWGNKHFDPERYPDPAALTDALHEMKTRLMISIWPNLSGDSEDRAEMLEKGYLLGDRSTYNAFDENARNLYWKQAYEGLFRYGIDGWWCDSSEPFDAVWGGAERPPLPERMKKSTDEFRKYLDDGVLNAYSLFHSKGMYENQRRVSEKRVLNLTRSGFAGQHRYGAVVWSGDVSANWETLRKQVRIVQNYTATGEAWWNSDIGSFFSGGGYEWFRDGDYPEGCDDPAYRELYTRWLQFAAFTPMMRSHGTNTPREVWRFGERGTRYRDAIEKAIRLRYALLPYFYSVHAAVTFKGTMPVTPLALAYPRDREAAEASGEYMYGHEFLVCPVTYPNAETTHVYLPDGGWYDFYNETYYEGGRCVKIPVGIDAIPLFVRAGSIIPVAPPAQSSAELDGLEYELRIYGGSDGRFTLYDDDGLDYDYENGGYTAVTYTYSDSDGKVAESLEGRPDWKHDVKIRIIRP